MNKSLIFELRVLLLLINFIEDISSTKDPQYAASRQQYEQKLNKYDNQKTTQKTVKQTKTATEEHTKRQEITLKNDGLGQIQAKITALRDEVDEAEKEKDNALLDELVGKLQEGNAKLKQAYIVLGNIKK